MAERRYKVESLAGLQRVVTVRIGFPVRSDAGLFECQAEIGDDSTRIVRPMKGIDAFEAIFVALMMIGVELTLFSSIESDRFSWLDGHQLGLQFPSMPDYSLNAIHEKPKD
jgi:hypothetical protein